MIGEVGDVAERSLWPILAQWRQVRKNPSVDPRSSPASCLVRCSICFMRDTIGANCVEPWEFTIPRFTIGWTQYQCSETGLRRMKPALRIDAGFALGKTISFEESVHRGAVTEMLPIQSLLAPGIRASQR